MELSTFGDFAIGPSALPSEELWPSTLSRHNSSLCGLGETELANNLAGQLSQRRVLVCVAEIVPNPSDDLIEDMRIGGDPRHQ
jgi:hypothetical protein